MWSEPEVASFTREDGFWVLPKGVVRECKGSPLGIPLYALEVAVQDPFQRALLLSRGVIAEYACVATLGKESYTLKRLWRVKSSEFYVFRGHPLKVKV